MKNILKKIVILALVATMTVMPSATVLAASTATPIVYTDTIKYYDFRPDAYILGTGQTLYLDDRIGSTDGCWQVPAFKNFNFKIDFQNGGSYRLIVIKTTGNDVEIINETIPGGIGYSFGIPMSINAETYKILIIGIDSKTVYGYCGTILD
jgi:hypothetical protein